ncbi:50S ribosomal protein L11 methyltransferase [Micromonospora sp. NPDC048999]|uniref:class I SAM-dependent methyltransferase n=1 Tax=Micromonospora sp. NPDC048999 TaxID=3155391 RepID=UPI0033E86377
MLTPPGALLTPFVAFRADEFDGLRLVRLPFVPGIRLYLADDAIVLPGQVGEARVGPGRTPFWANAWAGGQALARYVLDHPQVVAGRRVIDVASGSGLVAIAAAKAGAAEVTANDIAPYAPGGRGD